MKRTSDLMLYPFLVCWGLAVYSILLIPLYGWLMGVPDTSWGYVWVVPSVLVVGMLLCALIGAITQRAEDRVDQGAQKRQTESSPR